MIQNRNHIYLETVDATWARRHPSKRRVQTWMRKSSIVLRLAPIHSPFPHVQLIKHGAQWDESVMIATSDVGNFDSAYWLPPPCSTSKSMRSTKWTKNESQVTLAIFFNRMVKSCFCLSLFYVQLVKQGAQLRWTNNESQVTLIENVKIHW